MKYLLAPAFRYHSIDKCYSVTETLFSCEQDARDWVKAFHSWPALPNADGWYEVCGQEKAKEGK